MYSLFVINIFFFVFFFFSSRRRHTRWNCDWSSDVCSSVSTSKDLIVGAGFSNSGTLTSGNGYVPIVVTNPNPDLLEDRSEERRVGKECRYRWSPYHEKKKIKKGSRVR